MKIGTKINTTEMGGGGRINKMKRQLLEKIKPKLANSQINQTEER